MSRCKTIKKLMICLFALVIFQGAVVPAFAEEDIHTKISDWAKLEIRMPINGFGLDDLTVPVTREQFCDLIVEVLSFYDLRPPWDIEEIREFNTNNTKSWQPEEDPFEDTDNENVILLYRNRFVNGTSDTTFEPQQLITREMAACILYEIYMSQFPDTSLYRRPPVGVWADDDDISSWAYTATYLCWWKGIMHGQTEEIKVQEIIDDQVVLVVDQDPIFNPQGNMTAEEAIIAAQRLCKQCRK